MGFDQLSCAYAPVRDPCCSKRLNGLLIIRPSMTAVSAASTQRFDASPSMSLTSSRSTLVAASCVTYNRTTGFHSPQFCLILHLNALSVRSLRPSFWLMVGIIQRTPWPASQEVLEVRSISIRSIIHVFYFHNRHPVSTVLISEHKMAVPHPSDIFCGTLRTKPAGLELPCHEAARDVNIMPHYSKVRASIGPWMHRVTADCRGGHILNG